MLAISPTCVFCSKVDFQFIAWAWYVAFPPLFNLHLDRLYSASLISPTYITNYSVAPFFADVSTGEVQTIQNDCFDYHVVNQPGNGWANNGKPVQTSYKCRIFHSQVAKGYRETNNSEGSSGNSEQFGTIEMTASCPTGPAIVSLRTGRPHGTVHQRMYKLVEGYSGYWGWGWPNCNVAVWPVLSFLRHKSSCDCACHATSASQYPRFWVGVYYLSDAPGKSIITSLDLILCKSSFPPCPGKLHKKPRFFPWFMW